MPEWDLPEAIAAISVVVAMAAALYARNASISAAEANDIAKKSNNISKKNQKRNEELNRNNIVQNLKVDILTQIINRLNIIEELESLRKISKERFINNSNDREFPHLKKTIEQGELILEKDYESFKSKESVIMAGDSEEWSDEKIGTVKLELVKNVNDNKRLLKEVDLIKSAIDSLSNRISKIQSKSNSI